MFSLSVKNTLVVNISDLKISTQPEDIIITYALGSCLAVTIYDPVVKVGGMLHAMLPTSSINTPKARTNPCMFIDTGIPKLFLDCYKFGAKKERLIVKAAGGASINKSEDEDQFQIGKRNFLMLRKLLWKNGVLLHSHDVGGSVSRTMSLDISTGDVVLQMSGTETLL